MKLSDSWEIFLYFPCKYDKLSQFFIESEDKPTEHMPLMSSVRVTPFLLMRCLYRTPLNRQRSSPLATCQKSINGLRNSAIAFFSFSSNSRSSDIGSINGRGRVKSPEPPPNSRSASTPRCCVGVNVSSSIISRTAVSFGFLSVLASSPTQFPPVIIKDHGNI